PNISQCQPQMLESNCLVAIRSCDASCIWPISFPIVALHCQLLSLKIYTFHSKNTLVDESDVQALVRRFKKNCLNRGTAFVQTITGLPANLLSGNLSRLSAIVIPNVYSPLVSTWAW